MSAMSKSQKVMMKDFHTKFFALQEKYWNPDETEDYWDHVTEDAMNLLTEFHSSDNSLNHFLSNLIADFLNSREEIVV